MIIFCIFAVLFTLTFVFKLHHSAVEANRQWGQFLNQDFWYQNPNAGNIIYSLFWDGTASNTPYTRIWTGACIPEYVTYLPNNYAWGTLGSNRVYVLQSGNYTLNQNIVLGNCSAVIGRGKVTISGSPYSISATQKQHIILDNIALSGIVGIWDRSNNISLHNLRAQDVNNASAVTITGTNAMNITNSQIYNNLVWFTVSNSNGITFNNIMSYNNQQQGLFSLYSQNIAINNSQFYNDSWWVSVRYTTWFVFHNTIVYNATNGIALINSSWAIINNSSFYNNVLGFSSSYPVNFFGNTYFFGNTNNTWSNNLSTGGIAPNGTNRNNASLLYDTETMDHDRTANPVSSTNVFFLPSPISNRAAYRWSISYTFLWDMRYLFGEHILKQQQPVAYIYNVLSPYGIQGTDYASDHYIAEANALFSTNETPLINQYFWSWSFYTQYRSWNGCSLWAFQIQVMNPGNYNASYPLQSHTLYILNEGEYRFGNAGDGFVFSGNCIGLIGSGNVRIDKSNLLSNALISANNKHSLIIENLKIDGLYYGNGNINWRSQIWASFAGASYNLTINQVQAYNHEQYGLFLGAGSHHSTIINTQLYNNLTAGIYFYLASHHNIINNSMTYNNSGHGIRFANGSHRNVMNNFQSFNNTIGIFGDLTTKENIINRAMIYNNSQYGILLKNSSGNIFNDIQVYNNTTGIKVESNSYNNSYNGDFQLFGNGVPLEWTNANDEYLNATNTPPFTVGTITLDADLMQCSYVTNPTFSGSTTSLLNSLSGCALTGKDYSVFNGLVSSINYIFGIDIYKQTLPYRYTTNNTLQAIPTQYDSGKYIAEIFAIRDTVLEGVSFSFGTGDIEPNTLYTTNTYTAGSINTPLSLSLQMNPLSSWYLIINWSYAGLTGTIIHGDTIQIAMISAGTFSAIVTWTLVADGSPIATLILQTKWPDITPSTGSFAFATIVWAPLNTYTWSMVTVQGIDIGVLATINTWWIAIYSWSNVVSSGSTGTVYAGNQVLAMILSASWYNSWVTALITIGNGTGNLSVRTLPDTSSPILSFGDPVSSGIVSSDTISVISSGNTSPVLYKFISNIGECNNSGTTLYNWAIIITGEQYNGKYFCAYAELSGVAMPLVSQYTVRIDATTPTIPILLYPENSTEIFYVVLEWSGSYDSGAGISGYEYIIAEDYNFIDIVATWFVSTIGTGFSPLNFVETTGDFYRKIRAIDKLWLSSIRSSQWYFIAIDDENFSLDERVFAAVDTEYTSNEITIAGLRTYGIALATTDTWIIYKNNVNRWQSTYVQNGDKIAIKLTSSHDRDESIVSTLTIANRTTEYIVTTAPDKNSCTLDNKDKWKIQIIYDTLIAQYVSGDQNKYDEFLYTMRSMLQDKIDLTNDCNLQYLYDLLDSKIKHSNGTGIDTSLYIAPNCKNYRVSYDTGKVAYTSPDFKVATYFSNRNALGRYIDSRNPGNCHVSTTINGTWYFNNTDSTKHIAPNGKVYTIQHETQWYTSAELSVKKYFNTLTLLRKYLDERNPPFPIWSHVVDSTFAPINHTAPNGKTYTIYKTNRWYMSYKLMSIRYYTTLDAIKVFINKNNPK